MVGKTIQRKACETGEGWKPSLPHPKDNSAAIRFNAFDQRRDVGVSGCKSPDLLQCLLRRQQAAPALDKRQLIPLHRLGGNTGGAHQLRAKVWREATCVSANGRGKDCNLV